MQSLFDARRGVNNDNIFSSASYNYTISAACSHGKMTICGRRCPGQTTSNIHFTKPLNNPVSRSPSCWRTPWPPRASAAPQRCIAAHRQDTAAHGAEARRAATTSTLLATARQTASWASSEVLVNVSRSCIAAASQAAASAWQGRTAQRLQGRHWVLGLP